MTTLQHMRRKLKNPLVVRDMSLGLITKIFRWLFVIGMCYVFLFPILYIISVAFRTPSSVNDPSVVWVPKEWSLESLQATMDVLHYWKSTGLTLVIAIGSTLGTLISCLMVGYALARFSFWEKKLVFGLVLLTIIVPPQTILMSSYLNFSFFDFGGILKLLSPITHTPYINLLNTPWTFILPSFFASGLRAGLFIFICRQFFSGMPKDLEEAARIDGCGAFRTFAQIMVPLAKPAIITVLLFSFVWHWNDFYSSTMFFNDEVRPISVMLYNITELLGNSGLFSGTVTAYQLRTYTQAGALLTILPPLILYLFTQRHFTESIERTGLVG